MNIRPKGGRGCKAEHPTTTVRVPIGLLDTIGLISDLYRETGTDVLEVVLMELVQRKLQAKSTRNWVEMADYIETIESSLPANWLLSYHLRKSTR